MAIFHLSASIVSRKAGRSSTAAAAYRSGEKIADERTGEVHDYTRKRGVEYSEIITPEGIETPDRENLWNSVEQKNKRADAQVAREITLALPHELSIDERRELARYFSCKIANKYSLGIDLAIHEPSRNGDGRNHHAHLLLTTNKLESVKGNKIILGNKVRELDNIASAKNGKNKSNEIEYIRAEWARSCNLALEKSGELSRVDNRSLSAQGIDREATTHLGPTATQMERRGAESVRGNINREISDKTAEIERLQKALQEVTKELAEVSREIDQQEPEKQPISASAFLNQKEKQKIEPQKVPEMSELEAMKIIAQNKELAEVGKLVNQLRQISQKKDLQNEAQNTLEYKQKKEKIYSLDYEANRTKGTSVNFARMKDEVKGFFKGKEKAEYARLEEEEMKKYLEASSQLAEEKSKLAAIAHALTRPGSDLEKSVRAHNEKAEKAAEILKVIAPIYHERQAEQIRQEREQTKDRGGHER